MDNELLNASMFCLIVVIAASVAVASILSGRASRKVAMEVELKKLDLEFRKHEDGMLFKMKELETLARKHELDHSIEKAKVSISELVALDTVERTQIERDTAKYKFITDESKISVESKKVDNDYSIESRKIDLAEHVAANTNRNENRKMDIVAAKNANDNTLSTQRLSVERELQILKQNSASKNSSQTKKAGASATEQCFDSNALS